jgi:SAM-dependent methyltransferase
MVREAFGKRSRGTQAANTQQYDRVSRLYKYLEPLYLIFPPARRRAVVALGLRPGDVVLEVGAGTGRNLPYLVEAVGPTGTVIAVDASPGMLAEAQRLVDRERWSNVQLLQEDATQMRIDRELDGVLFSLSYSALPEPRPALARAWQRLRPSGRVVVMDMGLSEIGARRLLDPIARLLVKLGPGRPVFRSMDRPRGLRARVHEALPVRLLLRQRHSQRGAYRNRTGVNGFAGRCVATPPRRRGWLIEPNSGGFPRFPEWLFWQSLPILRVGSRQNGPGEAPLELLKIDGLEIRRALDRLRITVLR